MCVQVIIWTRSTSRWRIRRTSLRRSGTCFWVCFRARSTSTCGGTLRRRLCPRARAAAALVSGALAEKERRLKDFYGSEPPASMSPRPACRPARVRESGADQSCLAAVLERLHHALLRRPVALHAAPALFPADGHLLPGSAAGHGRRGDDGAGLSPALERSPGKTL